MTGKMPLEPLTSKDTAPLAPALDRITFESGKMGGRACIRGMRITVSNLLGQLAAGETTESILRDYPDLEQEDIRQAIAYAAWLAREEVTPG